MSGAEDFVREMDIIACDEMALRDWLDTQPLFAEVMTSPSPWHDGARIVIADLLSRRGDREQLITRLWAWDEVLKGGDR